MCLHAGVGIRFSSAKMSRECKFSLAVRLRPLNQHEEENDAKAQWKIDLDPELEQKLFSLPSNGKKAYAEMLNSFDYTSFNETQSNDAVYHAFVFDKVNEAMIQFSNHTFITYGSIGSGKTHTMLGTTNDPGIIFKAVEQIFANTLYPDDVRTDVRVSCLEIYNDEIIDLLNPENKSLKLSLDTMMMMIHSINCTDKVVTSSEDFKNVLNQAILNRKTDEINLNEESSRSHMILKIFVEYRRVTNNDGPIKYFELNFVDLAGHSHWMEPKTSASEKQKIEDFHIYASLGSLRNVTAQLNQLSDSHRTITFQESHLTKLLQLCLLKNTSTALLLTVSPAEISETCMTLQFASCFKYLQSFTVLGSEEWNTVNSLQNFKDTYFQNFEARSKIIKLFLTGGKEKLHVLKNASLQLKTVMSGMKTLNQLIDFVETMIDKYPEAGIQTQKIVDEDLKKIDIDILTSTLDDYIDGMNRMDLLINKFLSL